MWRLPRKRRIRFDTSLIYYFVIVLNFLASLTECVKDFSILEKECKSVLPVWNVYYGKPIIQLDKQTKSSVFIGWKRDSVTAYPQCVQAFEVEYRELGIGRSEWSEWSSMVNCAIIVEGEDSQNKNKRFFSCKRNLTDFDCDKKFNFRVLLHNIFNPRIQRRASPMEEALVQCSNRGYGNKFYVRTPHQKSYKEEKREETNQKTPTTTKTTTTSSTTTTIKSTILQSEENGQEQKKIYHEGAFTLLPGKYASAYQVPKYDVRHNLKNYKTTAHDLTYCGKYKIAISSKDCRDITEFLLGKEICLKTAKILPDQTSKKREKFHLMSSSCQGFLSFVQVLNEENCNRVCDAEETFIIV